MIVVDNVLFYFNAAVVDAVCYGSWCFLSQGISQGVTGAEEWCQSPEAKLRDAVERYGHTRQNST